MTGGITIILPCYNKEELITMTIESLENQTIVKNKPANFVEILCIDDCSKDNTYDILQHLARKYGNIRVLRNEENSGVFATRLYGIKESTKPYIAFMDPDDWADPTFYEELYNAAIKTKADITQTPSVWKEYGKDRRTQARTWYPNMPDGVYKMSVKTLEELINRNWLTLWNRMFKRESLIKIAAYPPYYINFIEDILIYISAAVISKSVCNVRTQGFYHYNLSMEIDHLSRPKGKDKRAIPTAQVFQLLNSFLMESKNVKYYDAIVKYRGRYISNMAAVYSDCFNIEAFGNDDYKAAEIAYVRKLYVELMKSLY